MDTKHHSPMAACHCILDTQVPIHTVQPEFPARRILGSRGDGSSNIFPFGFDIHVRHCRNSFEAGSVSVRRESRGDRPGIWFLRRLQRSREALSILAAQGHGRKYHHDSRWFAGRSGNDVCNTIPITAAHRCNPTNLVLSHAECSFSIEADDDSVEYDFAKGGI